MAGSPVIRVLQITDLHIMAQPGQTLLGVDTEASFRDVLHEAMSREKQVRLVLLTGDLAQDPVASAYHRLRDWLEQTGWEFCCLPGNHDDPQQMVTCLATPTIQYCQPVRVGRWQIISLNSTVHGSPGGFLATDQMDHLQACLTAYPDHHAVIALHHHPVKTGSAWLDTMVLDNRDEFLALIPTFPQVRLILTGHVHQAMDAVWEGVRLLATPSTCFQFKPGSERFALDGLAPGYRWLELHDDGGFSTGIVRLDQVPQGLDEMAGGY